MADTPHTPHKPTQHYLSELTKDELKEFLTYPSELYTQLYETVQQINGEYASDLMKELLGKEYHTYTKYDSTSYTWYLNIRPGCYAHALDITVLDYFSNDDADDIRRKQLQIQTLMDKMDTLDVDADTYYDELDELGDKADEIADEIIQIVVRTVKQAEEVTDEQVIDTFNINEMGDYYYYEDDDRTRVYEDTRKMYRTHIN